MKATILPNGDLRLTASDTERTQLRKWERWCATPITSGQALDHWFEDFIVNSAYDWVRPEYIGALTDAPILGIYGESIAAPNDGAGYDGRLAGSWEDEEGILRTWIEPVQQAWAYTPYNLRSPLVDLRDQGYCDWKAGM